MCAKKKNTKKIWITWEKQRRSIELSQEFNAELFLLLPPKNKMGERPFKYFFLSVITIWVLLKKKPKIVFGQNPSIFLALLLCCLKNILRYKLIIDRHSNFKLHKNKKKIKWRIFHLISKKTIEMADVTIITNEFLRKLVAKWGGRPFVLEDKLPTINYLQKGNESTDKKIVFVSSFNEDEPIEEILIASQNLPKNWKLYITGNHKKFLIKNKNIIIPSNIEFTGYISDNEYYNLLYASNLVVVLTKQEHTLTCGAYEAVSLEKPAIVSDTKAIRNYFRSGVLYAKPSPESIKERIFEAISRETEMCSEIKKFKRIIQKEWEKKASQFKKIIYAIY